MRQVIRSTGLGMALFCLFQMVPIASGQSVPRPQTMHHYICSTQDQSRPEIYFSGAFDSMDPNAEKMSSEFRQFLEQKYNFTNATQLSCFGNYGTLAAAEADLQKHVAQLTAVKREKVVATGWMYVSAAPISGAATAAPPPLQLPIKPMLLSQAELDARLAQMSPDDRKFALAEEPSSKSYCVNNPVVSALFDCDCFAKMVLDFRIAHPEAKIMAEGGRGVFPAPLNVLLTTEMLYCTECISDERLTKWVQSRIRGSLGKGFTETQITATADCTAKSFLTNFRAKPYVVDYPTVWALSVGPCEKTILNVRQ